MEEGCALDPPNPLKAAIEREENQTCLSSSEREQARPKVNLGFKLFGLGSKNFLVRKNTRHSSYLVVKRLVINEEHPDGLFLTHHAPIRFYVVVLL